VQAHGDGAVVEHRLDDVAPLDRDGRGHASGDHDVSGTGCFALRRDGVLQPVQSALGWPMAAAPVPFGDGDTVVQRSDQQLHPTRYLTHFDGRLAGRK
jgi:hypothetical protein